MKKKNFLLVLAFSFTLFYVGLAYGLEWAKSYGGNGNEEAYSIQQTSDGGYIVAGYTNSFGAGHNDAWVLKLDKYGNVEWQKAYGAAVFDHANTIQQTTDGGYIVIGGTSSFGAGGVDLWVLKLNSYGNIQWEKSFGGINWDYGYSVQQISNGGYIVAGVTSSFNQGNYDFWLLQLDSNGNVVWQKIYSRPYADFAYSIQQTSDGGYIVAGSTRTFVDGGEDVWVLKLDSDGDIVWQKTYGGSGNDYAYSIQQTSDGGYIVAGYTNSFGAGYDDIWVLKLNSEGDVEWQKTYGAAGFDYANSIQQTSDGGYIVIGETHSFGAGGSDVWVLKLDSNGNVLWEKTYGGYYTEYAKFVRQTSDGGYIVAGYTNSFGPGGEFWVLKLNADGDISMCELGRTSNATVNIPVFSQAKTSISPSEASFSGVNSTATITYTNITSSEQCYFNPPPVTVLRPNGGQKWNAGGSYVIKWDASSEAVKFKLYYSTDNQTTWNYIKGVGNVRQTLWTIPAQDGRKPKSFIKVDGLNSSGKKVGEDVSDKAFIIEVLKLTSPNGGETLKIGNTYTITWETYSLTKTVAKVILQYSTDGGSSWKGIKSFVGSNPGSFNWKVPNTPSTNCKVRVTLKDANGVTIAQDVSDGVFTIEQ